MDNECSTSNVFYTIDQTNNLIELEGPAGNFHSIEKFIHDLCSMITQRTLDDRQNASQWFYHDRSTNKWLSFDLALKRQLEKCYTMKQKGLVRRIIIREFL